MNRSKPEEIAHAVITGGRITRPTLDRLSALLKTIDNEDDALETIRSLEKAPDL